MAAGPLCCDTSFLFALYAYDVHTEDALAVVENLGQPITLSKFNEYELANALRFAEFRKLLNIGQAAAHLSQFETDVSDGRLMITPYNLAQAIDEAKRLSSKYTILRGHRSFDIIHVACALGLTATKFFTFDENQKKLARAEGLKTN